MFWVATWAKPFQGNGPSQQSRNVCQSSAWVSFLWSTPHLSPGSAIPSPGLNWLHSLAAVADTIPLAPGKTKGLPQRTFGSSLLPAWLIPSGHDKAVPSRAIRASVRKGLCNQWASLKCNWAPESCTHPEHSLYITKRRNRETTCLSRSKANGQEKWK